MLVILNRLDMVVCTLRQLVLWVLARPAGMRLWPRVLLSFDQFRPYRGLCTLKSSRPSSKRNFGVFHGSIAAHPDCSQCLWVSCCQTLSRISLTDDFVILSQRLQYSGAAIWPAKPYLPRFGADLISTKWGATSRRCLLFFDRLDAPSESFLACPSQTIPPNASRSLPSRLKAALPSPFNSIYHSSPRRPHDLSTEP